MNEELQKLHDSLLAQHQALYDKLDETADRELAKAIITEMQEILHRIDLVQGLLFRQTTQGLKNSVQKVEDTEAELEDALKAAETATDFVKGVGTYLALVDKAIDLAKTLAVA